MLGDVLRTYCYAYIRKYITPKYEKIARTIATNQIGMTVLLRYPTPKSRNDPSVLYRSEGLNEWMAKKMTKNNTILTDNL